MRMFSLLAVSLLIASPLFAQAPRVSAATPPPDVAAPPAAAATTPSVPASKVITGGSGRTHPAATHPIAHPSASSTVTVHYTGWTTDGKRFDSSVARGMPISFPLDGVIKGWTEGLQLMVQGEKTRFWIPDTLAYKDQPNRPQGTLVFDVEL